ncbi:MAG: 16S rRNA (guanine(966)-N(2))-methyltransferase RsmD [Alphaproteobacteria bacterium]|jgi:16S rRNA (guanine966-N2)-methyltransferase|nr:16S rRNA (guanine(966)-N(2))-methyltransferase RsmD [Alphaproteobacteria bacterium]MBT4020223.1 16S rRNA (guanine(966)-N(2))-methyltransferase RsmD [Alphaproteobacteria bacterium]MBT4964590.1 16S rRNA (guanine(966)-N(2))-methyltransferase RsmD [Alphaproteobacteria bacterium]MBT5159332.1 16S rRNA (guanine(966)-N(2))-methyltransferase RsmD [Alphaproteobacteria bacterium]MBT5917901.1 16S rRNA (guanine(966)-N(2))-methyltransferase RsmD [Alphaproteobacteria bacterium]
MPQNRNPRRDPGAVRIIGGKHKGRKLDVPNDGSVRPTSDRAREALFNILSHGDYRTDAGPLPMGIKVLDVFSGSGALGLEALSRGADHVAFLEQDSGNLRTIRSNAIKMGESGAISMLQRDGTRPGPTPVGGQVPADLVFLDAPYDSGLGSVALVELAKAGWLADNCLAVIETGAREDVATPEGFDQVDQRKYGICVMTIFRRGEG